MKSKIVRRTVHVSGRKRSISLEDAFWNGLRDIANQRHESVTHLIANIDTELQSPNLSSAIRLFVVGVYRDQFNSPGLALTEQPVSEAAQA
jgi:predicted DNA-binding ribbon-helix-helix protein